MAGPCSRSGLWPGTDAALTAPSAPAMSGALGGGIGAPALGGWERPRRSSPRGQPHECPGLVCTAV